MLRKLIKYDFKAGSALHMGMYIVALLSALLCFATARLCKVYPANRLVAMMRLYSIFLVIIVVIVLFAVTFISSIIRYYQNLTKDEGYLMHTLPVKGWQLHISKCIVTFVWLVIDTLYIELAYIVISDGKIFDVYDFIEMMLGKDEGIIFAVLMILVLILGYIQSMSIFYASVNIGSLSYSNKGVMSFVAYIVISLINQVVSWVFMAVFMFILSINNGGFIEMINSEVMPEGYFSGVEITSIVMSIFMTVVYSWISIHILSKRVNLE